MRLRNLLLVAHRWAGLTITLVLVVAGLTGAVLPFHAELNRLAAPALWHAAPPFAGALPLDGIELKRRIEAQTGGTIRYVPLELDRDRAQAVFVSARPDGPALGYGEVIADPYTGAIRRRVRYGDLCDGPVNWVPFLVKLHYSLAAGPWGRFAFGVAALIWCLECLAGIWLSLPRGGTGGWRERLRRWAPAWRVRARHGEHAFTYDLHRAAGLWLWPVMLVFTWSAVAFNLDAVHAPVQRLFGAKGLYRPVDNPAATPGEAMPPERAAIVGAALMRREAERLGFTIRGPEALSFDPRAQLIGYYARTSLDGPTERGSTVVWFDQVSGRKVEFRPPFGTTGADAFDKTVRMLHTADLFGLPYKLFVSAVGLLTAGMAITGFALWARRPRGRARPALRERLA